MQQKKVERNSINIFYKRLKLSNHFSKLQENFKIILKSKT